MLKNYLKIAVRNLLRNKVYSFINIGGLAVGMVVALLIGLWIWDELLFDTYHKNYNHIGQVWQFVKFGDEKSSYNSMPIPLAEELRSKYPDFKLVSLSSYPRTTILINEDKKFSKTGNYVEPDFLKIMSVKILAGTPKSLNEINSIMLSESLAKAFFDTQDPLGKIIKLDNMQSVKVTGIYEDFPSNSTFKDVFFLAPWDLLIAINNSAKNQKNQWDSNSFPIYAQLNEGADFAQVSAKIKDIRMKRSDPPKYKPEFFLHPMSKWHLYGDFKDGANVGGLITFVWFFGIIGVFVLFLACINFMNLSTARSEKRAKEVGIRKVIGSARKQLISQFFIESLLVSVFAFGFSLLLAELALPFFNEIADKKMTILWTNPWFWFVGLSFSSLTGLIAGFYPALYLSSFQPIKVLKGTFSVGRFATIPRKILVVFQFTVSITLIIGIITVFHQIEYAKNRSIGYNNNRLIEVNINTPELYGRYELLRNKLLKTGAVYEMSESFGSITVQYGGTTAISWRGKTPNTSPLVMANYITHDYGKTVGWSLIQGRDFSRAFSTDSSSIVLNEAVVKLMGFKNPIGELVRYNNKDFKVIGVIKDIIKEDPFKPVNPSFFKLDYESVNTINIKLTAQMSISEAIAKVENVFQKHSPGSPFIYNFVDNEFAKKFGLEERISKLASGFTGLAIFISCLGLFGLASFMAEKRQKEIGIRKVLGASIYNLWQLLSQDFVKLVVISFFFASPIAYYFMNQWLQNYQYRTEISWWIFALAGGGALLITLLTVSYQAIKAATVNPVGVLKNE